MSRQQRLVLKVNNREMTVADLLLYVEQIQKLDLPRDGVIEVEDVGNVRYFYAPLPVRKRKPKPEELSPAERAIQRAADRQIEARQNAVKNGEAVPGHVPPVQRTIKIRKSKLAEIKGK